MRTKLRRLIILAFGGVLVVGAACGSGGDSKTADAGNDSGGSDTTVTTAAAAGGGVGKRTADCDALKLEDIEGAIGAGFNPIADTSTGDTVLCATNRADGVSVSYTIKPNGASEYDATIDFAKRSGSRAEETSETVGEKATKLVTEKYGITVVQVIGVKGSALFYVTLSAQDGAVAMQAEGMAKTLGERI